MSLSISSGGVSSIPTGAEMDSFSSTLKNASSGDLLKALGKDGMEPWQKDAILKELENRAQQSQKPVSNSGANSAGNGGGNGGDDDEIKKLLKKLTKGTISPGEEQKLAGALGVDTQTLDAAKGGDAGGGDAGGGDIKGG
ncbi:hypothetical protein [Herbaspirillum huttiense]|uniref:Uncharacterized protein n=2 Tax=Herbaspirillum huttiense TaxID=863372 RepID=A0AAJ2HB91_9BURK|nr:hypothetical protein [Herbaspirillum huttiense]MDR9838898.1 hypothetical protein [Herbaspirillum huttiense]